MYSVDAQVRQFARMVFGEQTYGDELHRVLAPSIVVPDPNAPERACVFHRLLRDWQQSADEAESELFTDAGVIRSLGGAPEPERTALILGDVLNFSDAEIAQVLDVSAEAVPALVENGRNTYASRAEGSVFIVEDEPIIALDLSETCENFGTTVLGISSAAEVAYEHIVDLKPDVLLFDHMLEGEATGVDLFNSLQGVYDCAVVFITAFPEAVLTGAAIEPDMVIMKPYEERQIRAALAHALARPRSPVTVI